MLEGIEDLPVIADKNCGQCNESLSKIVELDNFSGWFGFTKKNGQMYQIPLCIKCSNENSKPALKESDNK